MITYQQYLEHYSGDVDRDAAEELTFNSGKGAYEKAIKYGHRLQDVEDYIVDDPYWAVNYAHHIIHGRWPEAEPYILKDAWSAYCYANDIIHGRWPEAEKAISTNAFAAIYYVCQILKDRWTKAENNIRKSPVYWGDYLIFLRKKGFSEQEKLGWIRYEGLTEKLWEILRAIGMEKDVQERVIQLRPDLIGEIPDLDPALEAKYRHEADLGRVDV